MTLSRVPLRLILLLAYLLVSSASSVFAVVVVQDGALVVQDDAGQALPQTSVTIDFNGTSSTGETDDDGVVPLVLLNGDQTMSHDRRDGAIVLIGDGTGTIFHDGGPEDGTAFEVREGLILLVDPQTGLTTTQWGLVSGGAALGLISIVALSGDSDTTLAPSVDSSLTSGTDPAPATNTATSTNTGTSAEPPSSDKEFASDYRCNTSTISNPGAHPEYPSFIDILIENVPPEFRISGNHSNFITMSGPLTMDDYMAIGEGFFSGYPAMSLFNGRFDPAAGRLTGVLTIDGTNLPGGQSYSLNMMCNQ